MNGLLGKKEKEEEEEEEERKKIRTNRKASPHFAEKPKKKRKKNQHKSKSCFGKNSETAKYMSYVCMKQNTGLFRILKFPMPFGLCAVNEV